MTAAGRWVGGVSLALAAAAAVLAAGSVEVVASSPVGEAAAAAMRSRLGPVTGAEADREAVLVAWEAAGARLRAVRRDLAANARPGSIDGAVLLVADLCTAALPVAAAAEPGDLLLYREAGTIPARWRVGMVTGWSTAAVVDPVAGRLEEVARSRLLDGVPPDGAPRIAATGSLRTCRISPALLPGGGGTGAAHRRIALVDAPEAVRALQWEFDHPRDADTGALHRLGGVVVTPLALASDGVSALLGTAGRGAEATLDAVGPPGAPWHLLAASFDGRGLHGVLTEALVSWGVGPAALLDRLPGPGAAVLRPVHATASFTVGLLTGVDDSPHVPVGGVALSVACDLLVLGKPLAAAGRLALGAGRLGGAGRATVTLRRTLDLSSRASDLLSGRPSTLLRLGGAAPRHPVHDVLDAASLVLRPSSIPGHIAELGGRLAHWGATVSAPSDPSSATERVLAAALHHLRPDDLHHVERLADLSHLHSGARTLSYAATGDLPTLPAPAPPAHIHLQPPLAGR